MQKQTKTGKRKIATKEVEGVVVGRNKTVVPPEEVYKLAQIGCKDNEIANWFSIDANSLRYNFSEELLKGRESLKQSLRRAQLKLAIDHLNPTMLVWLGKNLLSQSDSPLDTADVQPLPWNEE